MNQAKRFPAAYIATAMRMPPRQPTLLRQQQQKQVAPVGIIGGLGGVSRAPLVKSAVLQSNWRRQFHASAARRSEPMVPQELSDLSMVGELTMKIGDLANHGLTTILPTRMFEYLLEYAHVLTGLPWWATIIAVTVAMRGALLPLMISCQREQVRVNNVKPELDALREKAKFAQQRGNTMDSMQSSQLMMNFYKKRGIKPFRAAFGNLTLLPIMIFMFMALRDLTHIPVTYLNTGGALWFTDLSTYDPYFILPAISCVGTMVAMELQSRITSASDMKPGMKIMMRVTGVVAIAFTYKFPACVFIFWTTNNLISIFQSLLFHSKLFRRWANIDAVVKSTYVDRQVPASKQLVNKLLKRKVKFVVKHKPQK
ncbi:hypothetical protein GGH99_000111 [Coemansia sp. RSA 1285]|nr:hypothetical protein EV177_000462 [Coemansia sp. RSA 1804]KAJ2695465.1 hypothetical protein GGH99_000111 [Coemansia sp. RSA 1285]